MIKKRGMLFCLENVEYDSISNLTDNLKLSFKNQLKIMTINDMPTDKEKIKQVKEIESKSTKMAKRAKHMLYAMERWKKREEILKEIDRGVSVIIINYCFKEISEAVCEDLDLQWGKTHYTGLIRPDKVIYFDKQNLIAQYFGNFKYMKKLEQNNMKCLIEEIESNLIDLLKEYNKSTTDEFSKNFYPNSIGEDLFMYQDI